MNQFQLQNGNKERRPIIIIDIFADNEHEYCGEYHSDISIMRMQITER